MSLIEDLCPLVEGLLGLVGLPKEIACPIAANIPRLVELAKAVHERGGDVNLELGLMLDSVETAAITRVERDFK